jgi:hypothetical protein
MDGETLNLDTAESPRTDMLLSGLSLLDFVILDSRKASIFLVFLCATELRLSYNFFTFLYRPYSIFLILRDTLQIQLRISFQALLQLDPVIQEITEVT